jgi:DNA topoisomerase-1
VSKPLVVVESPTKVRTIKKYLGNDFNVVATVGHIKDLPQKEIGIDVEDGFKPSYREIPGKKKVITALKSAARNATDIYLAPDPDREGEAIAWHTADVLKKKGRSFHRVLFHELTKTGIIEAMRSPLQLNQDRYDAQQARRILDRLVGYQVSPLLWRKVKGGLSAGRVQTVAVRIICERERAIQAFEPEEYWSITAHLEKDVPPEFTAKLVKKDGEKFVIPNEDAANATLSELEDKDFIVDKVVKRTTRRNPQPPFTTSKLQQEAIRKLRFSAKKTMIVAQQLYEGIDLGPGEPVGLITYMRTDSTRISQESVQEARQWIENAFGSDYLPGKPRFYSNKKKVQDAHEAIRPTSVLHSPEKIRPYLSKEQFLLYQLIWNRFVACQMKEALINQMTVSIKAGAYQFTTSGSTVKFPGFMALYMSADQEIESKQEKEKQALPDLPEGTVLKRIKFDPKQHFTLPPPRFSEASLVKELEENGIGRPSTYAAILSTIRDKGYVEAIKGYFRPTELGFIVNDLLVANFSDIFNVKFTANMEDDLDRVEAGQMDYTKTLSRFYDPFKKELDTAGDGMVSVKGVGLPTGLSCPSCGGPINIKLGKNGHFLACSKYPDCRHTSDYVRDEKGVVQPIKKAEDELTDIPCDKCEAPMIKKQGKYGSFLACSKYPDCKHTRSLAPANGGNPTGVPCPIEGCDGEVVEKKSKRGKIFYGCNRYPNCKFAIWDKPVPEPCPNCESPYLIEKTTKKKGTFRRCPVKECGFESTGTE